LWPIYESTQIYEDNTAILNSSVPKSMLKKKQQSINYNYIRECVTAGIGLALKTDTNENPSRPVHKGFIQD